MADDAARAPLPMRRAFLESAALLGLTLGWALAWNALDPHGVALGQPLPSRAATDEIYLTHEAAARLWQSSPSTVFVDVRHDAAWRYGHIPGALHLSAVDFNRAWTAVAPRVRRDDDLVLYCDGPHCPLATATRDRLVALGFTRVRVYEGGWEAWFASGMERAVGDQ